MSDYTPATEQVANVYATAWNDATDPADVPEVMRHARAEFDRWLAEHDRQTAERAWAMGYQEGIHDHCDADDCDISRSNPHRKEQTDD